MNLATALQRYTPVEQYYQNIFVKREDLSCPPPGPPFSKMRGVIEHVAKRNESTIGVLDTYHSQAGHAVAYACALLGKRCINFYPVFKRELPAGSALLSSAPLREPQHRSVALGALTYPLQAGRSAILYHQARKALAADFPGNSYLMPNALKLPESVEGTAREAEAAARIYRDIPWVVSASSATLASGVLKGMAAGGHRGTLHVHMGYSRSLDAVRKYMAEMSGVGEGVVNVQIHDEGYAYTDKARPGVLAPFPCNEYYDLKAWRWLMDHRWWPDGVLFWNIGS